MTALAHERPETMSDPEFTAIGSENRLDLDEVVWQAWKAMELPEGYRAEIIEGAIEVSPTGRLSHARIVNRLRNALVRFLGEGEYSAYQDTNVMFRRRSGSPTSSSRRMTWSRTPTRTVSVWTRRRFGWWWRSSLPGSGTRTATGSGRAGITPARGFRCT